jgi:hypothetical protein
LEVVKGQRNEVLPLGSILSLCSNQMRGVVRDPKKKENKRVLEILVLLSLEVGSVRFADNYIVIHGKSFVPPDFGTSE